jgi:hypothetical protein
MTILTMIKHGDKELQPQREWRDQDPSSKDQAQRDGTQAEDILLEMLQRILCH